ncbi:hypothetical protein ACIP4T_10420 [Streptomyces massasporeus]
MPQDVLRRERGCSWQEATDEAYRMTIGCLDEYLGTPGARPGGVRRARAR